MPDLKAIEASISALPAHDLAKFRRWFAAFDGTAWDEQIKENLRTGKLDALLEEAGEDAVLGHAREL